MGHVLFIVLHLVALLFFAVALVVTIPLHLIYTAVSGRTSDPDTYNYVRCPACQELVHMDANICKHCRQKLIPYFEQRRQAKAAKATANVGRRWWQY